MTSAIKERGAPRLVEQFTSFSPPVEITSVDGNGRDFRYTSPSGRVLLLTRGQGQELPKVVWRQTPEALRGEFFIDASKRKPIDSIRTDSRVSIVFPAKQNIKEDITTQGPVVCVENGEFILGRSYIEVKKAKKVIAKGSSINNIANVAVAKDGNVDYLSLAGYTYVITKYGNPSTDIHPHGIDTIEVKGFENRINGYRVDGLGIYTADDFREHRGSQTNYGRYKDFTDPTEEILKARAMEMAARHYAREAERVAARDGDSRQGEQEADSISSQDKEQRRGRVAVLESVVFNDTYFMKYLVEAFNAAGIAPTKETEIVAKILTYVINDTDKMPPKGTKIRRLTPDALKVLAERETYPELHQLIDNLFNNPDPDLQHLNVYQHVSDIARANADLGMAILSQIHRIANAHVAAEEQAERAAAALAEQEARAALTRHIARQRATRIFSAPVMEIAEGGPDATTVVFEPQRRRWSPRRLLSWLN